MENKIQELLNTIPDNFTINGQKYEVELHETVELNGEPQLAVSELHKENPKVKLALSLDKNWPVSKGALLNAYYHELFHIILTHACIPDTELRVQSLANIFMQYEISKEHGNRS